MPDENSSNVSGTTILNGFSEMKTFHMGEIVPMKADLNGAYRFSALPATEKIPQLVATVEDEFAMRIHSAPENHAEMITNHFERTRALMGAIAVLVRDFLAAGNYSHELIGMATDGILNHPEKIQFLQYQLSDFNRQQRFLLAQCVGRAIRDDTFRDWMKELRGEKQKAFIADTANRNTYHVLNWFMRVAPADKRYEDWLSKAERVVLERSRGHRVESTEEFSKCFYGMCTSFVERFVELLAQKYLGKSLL
jgi:hypothetical protein